jgi:hypothetical protein
MIQEGTLIIWRAGVPGWERGNGNWCLWREINAIFGFKALRVTGMDVVMNAILIRKPRVIGARVSQI